MDGFFEATVDAPTPRPVSMLQNMNACNAVNIETGQGVTVASKTPPTGTVLQSDLIADDAEDYVVKPEQAK